MRIRGVLPQGGGLCRRALRAGLVPAMILAFAGSAGAQDDAKTVWQHAQDALAGGDRCEYQQLACRAAELDSKEKEYRKGCNDARSSLSRVDRDNLKQAHEQLKQKNFDSAVQFANSVCKANDKLEAEAQDLLKQVQKVRLGAGKPADSGQGTSTKADASAAMLAQAQAKYDANDFAQAVPLAMQVTDPDLKAKASALVNNVNAFTAALTEGSTAERDGDLAAAVRFYTTAAGIKSDGPGAPQARITALQRKIASLPAKKQQEANSGKPTPPAPPTAGKDQPPPPPKPEDDSAKIAHLLAEARQMEGAGNLQGALKDYEAVQHLQAANADAGAGRVRVETAINRDPSEQAKTLTQAIRDFYELKYADAEDELTTYLASPTAKSKGAANFYLGATRLYRRILDGSQKANAAIGSEEVQRHFKAAKAAGYEPLPRFLSPLVLRAWHSAN